jgi:anti-sigma B factor antagonist
LDNKLKVRVSFYQDSIGIVTAEGELNVFIDDSDLFYREMRAYIKMGLYRFILDLNYLTYIDSSGVSIIMQLVSNAIKKSSSICLICDNPQILKILGVSSVDKFVHFVRSVEEGIEYYKAHQ